MKIRGVSTVLIMLLTIGVGLGLPPRMRAIADGSWGGPHVNLTVRREGFSLDFDCAAGSAKGPIAIDRKGRFKLYGIYVSQPGAPSALRVTHPAEYSGLVKGKRMTLARPPPRWPTESTWPGSALAGPASAGAPLTSAVGVGPEASAAAWIVPGRSRGI